MSVKDSFLAPPPTSKTEFLCVFSSSLLLRHAGSTTGAFPSDSVRQQAEAWLDKCLPVLNGLLFTKPGNKAWLLSQTSLPRGLAPTEVRVSRNPLPPQCMPFCPLT